jgi:hypothetical protein
LINPAIHRIISLKFGFDDMEFFLKVVLVLFKFLVEKNLLSVLKKLVLNFRFISLEFTVSEG